MADPSMNEDLWFCCCLIPNQSKYIFYIKGATSVPSLLYIALLQLIDCILFYIPWRIFHSYGDVAAVGEGLQT